MADRATTIVIEDDDGFRTEHPWPDERMLLANPDWLAIYEREHEAARVRRGDLDILKVVIAEALLRINEDRTVHPDSHPIIPPTAVDWIAASLVGAIANTTVQVEVRVETLNEVLARAPESFDGEEAIDAIAIKYVRWLEWMATGHSDPAEVSRVLNEQVESELEAADRG